MVMFTGFLGAGKTTMLMEFLGHLKYLQVKSDVILNDRENAQLDRATLSDHATAVQALTGACMCCDGYHDLIDMIMTVSESKHDVLLIEFNGTSDPLPLQESLTLLESKFYLRPRWQVCVIDARYFGKREFYSTLESLQLETASHFYISWASELSHEEEYDLLALIDTINPHASRTTPLELANALYEVLQINPEFALTRQSVETKVKSPFKKERPEINERHQVSHAFTGCQILFPAPVDLSRVLPWLGEIPNSVVRAKALLSVESDDEYRYMYQRVADVVSPSPIKVKGNKESPNSAIFIGSDLNPEEIINICKEHLSQTCHFPKL